MKKITKAQALHCSSRSCLPSPYVRRETPYSSHNPFSNPSDANMSLHYCKICSTVTICRSSWITFQGELLIYKNVRNGCRAASSYPVYGDCSDLARIPVS